MTPLKGNAKPKHIVKMEALLKKLQKKQGIYNRAIKRGEKGIPLTMEEKKQLKECLRLVIENFHPRS